MFGGDDVKHPQGRTLKAFLCFMSDGYQTSVVKSFLENSIDQEFGLKGAVLLHNYLHAWSSGPDPFAQ